MKAPRAAFVEYKAVKERSIIGQTFVRLPRVDSIRNSKGRSIYRGYCIFTGLFQVTNVRIERTQTSHANSIDVLSFCLGIAFVETISIAVDPFNLTDNVYGVQSGDLSRE